jgi:ABC-type branched-subunit amino acid transport system substrate-binding protein
VIVTQVVPHFDSDLPIVRAYREALAALNAQAPLTFGSLEGYVAARILIRALRSIQGPPTREAVVDALEGLGDFDIGLGIALRLTADEHQASHTVWPTILLSGRVRPLDWAELSGSPGAPSRAAR